MNNPTWEQIQSGEDYLRNVLGCTEEEIAALGKKIPEGLVKCEVCGEYRGRIMSKDLNWSDSFDKENKEKSDEYLGVSCLCDGVLCRRCKTNKVHRPISNSYDEKSNSVSHWPYFAGMMPCIECKKYE